MSILITGASGQLGTELRHLLDEKQIPYTATDTQNMDITDASAVEVIFNQVKPTIVFHCAAYTAVDNAEDDGKAANWKVNADGTRNIAEAAEKRNVVLVYVSTDYVFDGIYSDEIQVDASTNPKNEYGKAKLAGEQAVANICSNYYIVRTSWVFGQYGKNFVYTMLRLAENNSKLTVVNDQIGRPTWTRTLAEFLLYLHQKKPSYGIYHLSNENSCSWYEFATEILKDSDVDVKPVTSEEYPQKAYRPRHSVLDLSKAKSIGFDIPTWQEALEMFLKQVM